MFWKYRFVPSGTVTKTNNHKFTHSFTKSCYWHPAFCCHKMEKYLSSFYNTTKNHHKFSNHIFFVVIPRITFHQTRYQIMLLVRYKHVLTELTTGVETWYSEKPWNFLVTGMESMKAVGWNCRIWRKASNISEPDNITPYFPSRCDKNFRFIIWCLKCCFVRD